jgi:hypothetical protein
MIPKAAWSAALTTPKTQKNPQQCSRYNSIAVFSPHYEVENAGIKRL